MSKAKEEMVKEFKILNQSIKKAQKAMLDFILSWDKCSETLDKLNKD